VASDPRPTTSEDHAPAAIASAGAPLRLAHSRYPHYRAFVRLADEMLEALPPAASSSVRYWLMPAAKRTLARLNG
jgi:hypothetical protein